MRANTIRVVLARSQRATTPFTARWFRIRAGDRDEDEEGKVFESTLHNKDTQRILELQEQAARAASASATGSDVHTIKESAVDEVEQLQKQAEVYPWGRLTPGRRLSKREQHMRTQFAKGDPRKVANTGVAEDLTDEMMQGIGEAQHYEDFVFAHQEHGRRGTDKWK
ncbi:MAG: hypothetical protein MHM6MM_006289, partial [Cercozoa sp. M6MM]